jgi:AraC-like DNA-binding protein
VTLEQTGISVALLRPMADLVARLGGDRDAFLADLGIEDDAGPDAYVDGQRVDRVLAELAAARGDPAFGLTLARESLARPLGLFGHLVWLSGTLRDAMTRATKFYGMISRRVTLTLHEDESLASIRQHAVKGARRGSILAEMPFASLALRARAATNGRFALRSVRFAHPGKPAPAHREVFGVPVVFGADVDEIAFDAALLDLELAGAEPITAAALEPRAAELAAEAKAASTLVARVRRIAEEMASAPEHDAIAKRLGMSARSLRRGLEKEGRTLREIVDDARRARADAMLKDGIPVKEVAFALGFSEASAFSRAYKRWTGKAPAGR